MKKKKNVTKKIKEIMVNFLDPTSTVLEWDVKEGSHIADLGCGGGYFTLPLAHLVGQKGKIFAVDILESSLESVRSRAYLEKLSNINYIRTNLEKKNSLKEWIKNSDCQMVLLANTLHSSLHQSKIITEAHRLLDSSGKLIVIDWKNEKSNRLKNFGPPANYRLNEQKLKEMIIETGFSFEKKFEAGKFHFGLIFNKK